jgi:hypothetical protein
VFEVLDEGSNNKNKKEFQMNIRDSAFELRELKEYNINNLLHPIFGVVVDLIGVVLKLEFLESGALHLGQIDNKAKNDKILHRRVDDDHVDDKL